MHSGGKEMFNDVTLGKFSYDLGGHIYLAPGENMEYGCETASCMHELYHANLALSSNLGMLMHMIELEIELEQDDYTYKLDLINKRSGLYKATREIQEVYANTLELLWVQECYGIETREQIYKTKTDEYKQYLAVSENVWKNENQEINVRRKCVHDICRAVLDINIFEDTFWSYLDDYLRVENHYRLNEIIQKDMCTAFQNGKYIGSNKNIEQNEILEIAHKRFKHLGDKLEEAVKYSKNIKKTNLTDLLLENVSTFEISELELRRGKQYESQSSSVCIIHNVQTNDNLMDVCILQYFSNDNRYEIVKVEKNMIEDIVANRKFVIIPYEEFSFVQFKSKYDRFDNSVVFVLINSAKEFKKWIHNIKEYEEIYIGDIREKTSSNFFTVIYFRKRNCDKIIFMFPTLSILAENIFRELNVDQEINYTGNKKMGFYNIFSAFNNWVDILLALKETVSFVTKSKGNILQSQNPCAKILNQVKFDIGDNIFRIVGDNYFYLSALFPTVRTTAMPFWILMEFEDGENNGNIRVEESDKNDTKLSDVKSGIVYFYSKEQANMYRKQMIEEHIHLSNYQVVGLDDLFWKALKPYLQIKKMGMIFVEGRQKQGVWNDVEQFEYLRMKEMEKL
jgi:hypothetical protein